MTPYGIIIKQNRIVMQQSLIVWQQKFGFLKPSKFIALLIPLLSAFAVIYCTVTVIFEKSFSPFNLFIGIAMNMLFLTFLMYMAALKTVKNYAESTREESMQLVLTEDTLEITTEFSKETVPYNEIDFCYEKNFILTLITDKNAYPLSVSKMHLINGNYDMFTSILRSKVQGRYEKKGEN